MPSLLRSKTEKLTLETGRSCPWQHGNLNFNTLSQNFPRVLLNCTPQKGLTYSSLHYQRLTGKAKGSLHSTEARNIRKLTSCCTFAFCMWHSFSLDSNSMIVLPLRSLHGLRDILLSIYGSLYYGLVCSMILLKEQDHYVASTSNLRQNPV